MDTGIGPSFISLSFMDSTIYCSVYCYRHWNLNLWFIDDYTSPNNGSEDIIILEASNEIEGRLHKQHFTGHTIELGAGGIAGVGSKDANPIWELAKRVGLCTCFLVIATLSAISMIEVERYINVE
ncbi:unnamed protein product [Amaranthus hypochondriacus]